MGAALINVRAQSPKGASVAQMKGNEIRDARSMDRSGFHIFSSELATKVKGGVYFLPLTSRSDEKRC